MKGENDKKVTNKIENKNKRRKIIRMREEINFTKKRRKRRR